MFEPETDHDNPDTDAPAAEIKAETLPAAPGFQPEHRTLTSDLISRIIAHLQSGQLNTHKYEITESAYPKGIDETLILKDDNIQLFLSLRTTKQ